MHHDHAIFLNALHGRVRVVAEFLSEDDGRVVSRSCAPMDFGPSRRYRDGLTRYHLWDYDSDSPTGAHPLLLVPAKVRRFVTTEVRFDPAEFVTWAKIAWLVPRDWGAFS